MFKIIFQYECHIVTILSELDDKIKKSIDSLINKINLNINEIYFLYNGERINTELTLNQIVNNIDKERKEMNIIVQNLEKSMLIIKKPKAKEIICPICKENILISIKNYRMNLYDCINNHKINDILFSEYEKTQKSKTNTYCYSCKNEIENNNKFFKCVECEMKMCSFCKEKHLTTHHFMDCDDNTGDNNKSFICNKHNEFYFKYCYDCKIDLCKICEKEHENHYMTSFEGIIPKKEKILKQQTLFNEKIGKFINVINDFIKQLNFVLNNIESYSKICNDYLYKLDIEFKNHKISHNIKEFFDYNEIIIKDLEKIISEKSFDDINKICLKMMNKNVKNMNGYKPIINNNKEQKRNNRYNETNDNFFKTQRINIKEEKTKKNNINVFQNTKQSVNINKNLTKRYSLDNTKKEINNEINKTSIKKENKGRNNITRPSSHKKNLFNNSLNENNEPYRNRNKNINIKRANSNFISRDNIQIHNSYDTIKKDFTIQQKQKKNIEKTKVEDDIYDQNYIMSYEQYYPSDDKEILCLHIGKTGLEVGLSCWELFCFENNIQPNGELYNFYNLENGELPLPTFFNETKNYRFVPRSIFIDPDPTLIQSVKTGNYRDLFRKENFIFGLEESSKLYSSRYSPEGKELINITLDRIDYFFESCGKPQGLLIFNSIGGGTGSGLSSLLLEELSNKYPEKQRFCFPIYPTTRDESLSVPKINSILSISNSIKYSNIDFLFQNAPIADILNFRFHIKKPSYLDINRFIAQVVSSIIFPLSDFKDVNMLKYINLLVPFSIPKLHFLLSSYSPLYNSEIIQFESLSIDRITRETFYKNSMLADCLDDYNKLISSCFLYKGYANSSQVQIAIANLINKYNIHFVDWNKSGFQYFISNYPPKYIIGGYFPMLSNTVCRISNMPGINIIFNNLKESYYNYKGSNFIHPYISEGMEEQEFKEAVEDLSNLENDYNNLELQIGSSDDDE